MALPNPRQEAHKFVHSRALATGKPFEIVERPGTDGETIVLAQLDLSAPGAPRIGEVLQDEMGFIQEPYRLCSHLYGRFDHPTDPSKSDPPGQHNVYA